MMVKDILPGGSSSPDKFFVLKNQLYFFATTETNYTYELFKTDGTESGTVSVFDFSGEVESISGFISLQSFGTDEYFFSILNGVNSDNELWKTDGTAGGTLKIKDINTAGNDGVFDLFEYNGAIYFQATNGTSGEELWKTDGTEVGTMMVKDINPGANSSTPHGFTNINNKLIFFADDGTHGIELWQTNGTENGTVILKDINLTGNSFLACISLSYSNVNLKSLGQTTGCKIVFNDELYFSATDGVNGWELWKTDGTADGTVMVKNINPTGNSNPQYFKEYNNKIYFQANDGTNGIELWQSDGTEAGTIMTKDINPGSANSNPLQISVVMNDKLYFSATDATYGNELWAYETDGTAPSIPSLSSSSQTTTSISLTWEAATDNIGVASYNIYKNGSLLTNITNTTDRTFTDPNLTPATSYTYTISALDQAGNESFQSSPITVSTLTLSDDPIVIVTPIETPQKAKIDSYKIYQKDSTKNCTQLIKIEIQGKNFDSEAKIEIGDTEAKDTNKKDSKNISATFCLDKMLTSLTKNPNRSSKKELSITNPDADKETADKKIDLNNLKYSFKKTNLNTNTKEGIKNIQTLLYQKGYLKNLLYITGNYGEITKEAVRNFQKDKGLPVIGLLDAKTIKKLSS
jgi:ELWxxDGT repeat protein